MTPCLNPLTLAIEDSKILIAGGSRENSKSRAAIILKADVSESKPTLQVIPDCSVPFTSEGVAAVSKKETQTFKFIACDDRELVHLMSFNSKTFEFKSHETYSNF